MHIRLLPTFVLLAVFSLPAAGGIISTFDSGSEDWTVAGDGADTSVTYIASGCDPGGCIQRSDMTSGYMHFAAPAAFLGDLSKYIGGALSYDLLQSTSSADTSWYYRLVIQGNGMYLLSTVELPPDTGSWVHVSTPLLASSFMVIPALKDYSGPPASQTQFDAVMGAVTGLFITGDLIDGDQTTGNADAAFLDNVALDTPEPATAAFVAFGLLLLVSVKARR
jgi:hypothetical protein